ncbi:amidase [Ventosimonas gracilis]|uniref:Amidase n=1 Tax=Ventosimonas gracilis TaxID=1680762 RepID=A0A139SHP7_9GAMM|nr:amidase [Ventosimonas gracilis]KXU34098.1 amidase [Ventosimonas gracilis]
MFEVTEASIADLRRALDSGETTAVELVKAYFARMDAFDAALNSVVVRNADALAEAKASDRRRARGMRLSALDGIAYTAKDSYLVKGMTAASGSPAFKNLQAQRDAFTVERLRAAGAICLGKTNMPPMANGGMQRGVYGRAESPYNGDFLTAPFASGSSNGAGTATAASFAAFGLAEETWSSGRGPASNNGLCAYTPSRGVISVRGNWPLVPTMDVVVPYARTMADLLEVLEVIVADDADTRGDLWRMQPWLKLPKAREVRPASYLELAKTASLKGKRFGVPKMYINADPLAGTGARPTLGGATGEKIKTRGSVIKLWQAAQKALEAAGAEVLEVDFPLVSNYEGDRPGAPNLLTRGLISKAYWHDELWDLSAFALDDFLKANNDPSLNRLADVDGEQIFPHEPGTLPGRPEGELAAGIPDMAEYVRIAQRGIRPWQQLETLENGLRGLEQTRKLDLQDWMQGQGLDALVFPAVADIGPADADVNPKSAELAWRNGVWVANGNLAIRHLGVPTVTVPMGLLDDIGMPVGLTFAGCAYDDNNLLRYAAAFEATGKRRIIPPRTPALSDK